MERKKMHFNVQPEGDDIVFFFYFYLFLPFCLQSSIPQAEIYT